MKYDLSNIVDSTDAKFKLKQLIERKSIVEIKEIKRTRSSQQNRALHKFFVMISDLLNEQGQEFHYTGLKGLELSTRYTPEIVKQFFWKPIQMALFNIESTTKLDTIKINEISDVIIKYFADKGVFLEFPHI